MLMIAFTTMDLFNYITARGRVFDIAVATLSAATSAKAPVSDTFGPQEQRDFICTQLYASAVGLAVSAQLPGAADLPPTGGCSSDPSPDARLSVDLIALSTLDEDVAIGENPNTDIPFERKPSEYMAGSVDPINIRVCIAYMYPPQMGLLYFASGVSLTAQAVENDLTWRFCGRTSYDPRRSY